MQGFPGAGADSSHLYATMQAIEHACTSIQMHINPEDSEKILVSLHQGPMPYHSCRFILENSHIPNARFQAASAIRDAALREWGVLTNENKRCLILFCLSYVMERAGAADGYVQSKVSAVASQLIKRGWLDFPDAEKAPIFTEVKQAIIGVHGIDMQFAGINFLDSLVLEFSPSTYSKMGLPAEFHDQCRSSFEQNFLKEFYIWAQNAALSVNSKVMELSATLAVDKVCSTTLRLMSNILSWEFKGTSSVADISNYNSNAASCGIMHDTSLLKKFERSVVQPGSAWHDVLIASGHVAWVLNLYATLREKHAADVIWLDSPLAVSARQLIVQLCSLTGPIFPCDSGKTQIMHLLQLLSAVIQWIDPPEVVIAAISAGKIAESEMLDCCHALLSIATLTNTTLFDNLLRSIRPSGTIQLLSVLTSEVVKAHTLCNNEEDTWSSETLDILLEIWCVILGRVNSDRQPVSSDGIYAAGNAFSVIVDAHLKECSESAYKDDDKSDHFHASVSRRDEKLSSYSLIARAAPATTIPLLMGLLSERFSLLSQVNIIADPTRTMEEIYWLLLVTGHVLADSGEGETLLIPEALKTGFPDVSEEQHPVVALSWSIINFASRSLEPEFRPCFSPRLMEAVIWFLARWADTYLMPVDSSRSHVSEPQESQLHKSALLNFSGGNDQGKIVLDIIVRVSMTALAAYPGESELQALTCYHLLVALVRRRGISIHLVSLDSWRDLSDAFANGTSLLSLGVRLQRSLARSIVSSAIGLKDSDSSNKYVSDVMGPITTYLVNISARNDMNVIAQQADAIYMVTCMLERLRGAARATHPRTQKVIFEMGLAVMNPLSALLEIYKNQPAVVYLILKFVVDFVDGQVSFLDVKDTSILVNFCLRLLETYSSHNIGKISLSYSSSLLKEAQSEKYKDIRALLQLLTNICSKDLVDFSSSDEIASQNIADVIYLGFHIVTPLVTLDLLKYPKLSHDYFALLSHMLEVYPEKIVQLNHEAFSHIIGALDFGLHQQDIDVVDMCLKSINALATHHYKERLGGKEGFSRSSATSQDLNGKPQENFLGRFLHLLLRLLLFENFRTELAGSAADALLPLLLCEKNLFERMVQELLEKQPSPSTRVRLANAFQSLTSSNQLSSSLDRTNRQKFRKNLHAFLVDVSGFMRIQ